MQINQFLTKSFYRRRYKTLRPTYGNGKPLPRSKRLCRFKNHPLLGKKTPAPAINPGERVIFRHLRAGGQLNGKTNAINGENPSVARYIPIQLIPTIKETQLSRCFVRQFKNMHSHGQKDIRISEPYFKHRADLLCVRWNRATIQNGVYQLKSHSAGSSVDVVDNRKLPNNAPADIHLCRVYLNFLRNH